jgi:mannose-6-phosphate isomerase-like protein (cupin superfamily)
MARCHAISRKVAMRVRNYRKVRPAPVIEEPGVSVRWLINEMSEVLNFALRLYEMEPGSATASCIRYWEHQLFVLSGKGVVIGQNGGVPLGEGDVVYIPPAEPHQFANRGDEVLRFLMVLPSKLAADPAHDHIDGPTAGLPDSALRR